MRLIGSSYRKRARVGYTGRCNPDDGFPSRERPPPDAFPAFAVNRSHTLVSPCNPEERAMKHSRCRRLLYLSRIVAMIGFAIALAAPSPSDASEIKVLTTRAMNQVLTELAGAFQRTSEHKITLVLAPPN